MGFESIALPLLEPFINEKVDDIESFLVELVNSIEHDKENEAPVFLIIQKNKELYAAPGILTKDDNFQQRVIDGKKVFKLKELAKQALKK